MPACFATRTARCAALLSLLLLVACSFACADSAVFSENFDDGNWTENPTWVTIPADPSMSISSERCVSAPNSLKIAAANNMGAIATPSGLTHRSQTFTCAFDLYVESIPEEGIPWCLRDSGSSIVAIVFLLPNGRVQLAASQNGSLVYSSITYALSYGQWHEFKVTYDGSALRLFIDNHAEPDAIVNGSFAVAPTELVIGNMVMAHTGTFFVDDIVITASEPPPPPPPGKVYIQFCSDTSTGGLNLSTHYNTFPVDDYSYTSPTGQAAQVMAESWRNAHLDSFGNKIKLTWYMNCGSLYTCGLTSGPLLPYELMVDNHGEAIARWGDEMAYHYHTWWWDGAAWIQTAEFTPCLPDFELVVANFILERNFYPCSFRSGWNWMSNLWENYLDDWFPYRFEGYYPVGKWVPYHPSATNWKAVGDLRGWESYHYYTVSLTPAAVEAPFAAAYQGTDQVVTWWSHLKETDFATRIDQAHAWILAAQAKYPTVQFEYVTGREAMLKWRGGTDVTPPVISFSTSDADGQRTAVISTNEDIYQKQPFVALAKTDGTYTRLDTTALGGNRWQVSYSLADTAKIGVGVTDWFGNAAVKQLPAPFLLMNAEATAASTTVDVRWESSQPADAKLDYRTMPSGTLNTYQDADLTTSHHVTLTGLQPATVYKLDVSGASAGGEQASLKSIYVLTGIGSPAVVDNSDPGFSVIGTWTTGTTAAGHYGADYRYANTSPTGTSLAEWTWQAPEAGLYRVSLWWSQGSNRSAAAPYTVVIGGTEYLQLVNQQANGGKWNEHGVYYLASGETVTVQLANAAPSGFVVIADATRFERAYVPLESISVGRLIGDGSWISLPSATVTGVFGDGFYIQQFSHVPGIKVLGGGVTEGSLVEVSGALSTVNGERVIANPAIR